MTNSEVFTAQIATDARTFGFIPIPLHGKAPYQKGWIEKTSFNSMDGFASGDNVGIMTGEKSGVLVIDVDMKENGVQTWAQWTQEFGIPDTPTVITGGGGLHVYFKYEPGFKSNNRVASVDNKVVGIDIKTDGGQVVYPGSIHPDTRQKYIWSKAPTEYDLQPLPEWLKSKIQDSHRTAGKISHTIGEWALKLDGGTSIFNLIPGHNSSQENNLLQPTDQIQEHGWNQDISPKMLKHAVNLLTTKLPQLNMVYDYAGTVGTLIKLRRMASAHCPVCNREHDHENAYIAIQGQRIVFYCRRDETKSIVLQEPSIDDLIMSKLILGSHQSISEIVLHYHARDFLCASSTGPIYIYNDDNGTWIQRDMSQFGYAIYNFLVAIISRLGSKKFYDQKRCKESPNKENNEMATRLETELATINECIAKGGNIVFTKYLANCICTRLAYSQIDIIFDNLVGFIPVVGKMVVNLKTRECIPRTREHYFTFEIQIRYNPNADSALLNNFMAQIMLEDDKSLDLRVKVLFLQRLLGYSLTSECKEQIMAVMTGEEGSNGKSTLFKLIKTCFPAIVKSAQKSIIMKKVSMSSASPELHELRSARLVFVCETGVDEHIDEAAFKQMTGGDEVRSRPLFGNGEWWTPKYLLCMLTNSIPKCTGDQGTLRRILIFLFNAKFVANPTLPHERKEDKNISDLWAKKEIREAFLNWMVIGASNYYAQGLNPPQEILDNTEDFKKNSDSVAMFMATQIQKPVQDSDRIKFDVLYEAYEQYCLLTNLTKRSKQALGRKLVKVYTSQPLNGYPVYNVRWKNPASQAQQSSQSSHANNEEHIKF